MNRVYLSLGSNIDKEKNLPAAVRLLQEQVAVKEASAVFETAPVGTDNQPSFFNTAVLVETNLSPAALKDEVINVIEAALHRRRSEDKNAPRTIDIDIALFNDDVLDYVPSDRRPRHIPDPDLLTSLHAIAPLADLAPEKRHPETGERLRAIASKLQQDSAAHAILRRDDFVLSL
ncbi:MAG: 2-amino-4-hydroxy-6-hydroxymethyldihydropteridine diphosphokinase [Candidatus Promineifilaceae bacterium]